MIGNKLKQLRIEKNLSPNQAAELLKMKPAHIRQIEYNACFPNLKLFAELCRLYGVSSDFVLSEELRNEVNEPSSVLGAEIDEALQSLSHKELEILKHTVKSIIDSFKVE